MSNVVVICAAGDLPEFIEVDLADAEVGTHVHLSDLVLPKGVQILALTYGADHDSSIAHLEVPKGAAEEAEGEEAPAAE